MTNKVTLTRFIIEQQCELPEASGTFTLLLNNIVTACKQISHKVNRGQLIGVLGSAGSENVQGEVQKKLDIITNDIMVNALNWTGHLAGMASEEIDEFIAIPPQYKKGKYLALFDPLDGSSNIDANLAVGTIFSILRCREGVEPALEDFLRKGSEQVCAGFVLYGPSTMMVLSFVEITRPARPSISMVTSSNFIPTSSEMTVPPVTAAISASRSFLRSP